MKRNIFWLLVTGLAVVSMAITSCGAPAPPPEPEQIEVEVTRLVEVAGETQVETETIIVTATPEPEDPEEAERRRTVIFDNDGGRVEDPTLFNPFVPGRRKNQGFHQAMIEPLFILNYETGQIEPWLGLSFTGNETMDVWTLVLRDGVKWSDGEDYDADDVVFSIQMFLDNAPDLLGSAAIADWVESVEKVNKTTVRFYLTRPNPRFQLDMFSVRIWGDEHQVVPEHIWKDQDPLTFKNYDPDKGWPVFTGPYLLESVSETEFTWVRDDNWWGAQAAWKPLPRPEKLVWIWAGPEETRAALMADGQLDSLMDVTLGALEAIKAQNPNVITWFDEMPYAWVPDPCARNLDFNHLQDTWGNKNLRWAVNFAIDRDEIIAISYEGTTLKSTHFFPGYDPLNRMEDLLRDAGLYDTYPIGEHNPEKAKELIEAEGYTLNSAGYYEKDGVELTMDISCHEAFIEKQRIAQVLVEQFQRIGINASMRIEAGQTWGDNFDFGTMDTRMGWSACASVNEPWASMDIFNTKWTVPQGERASGNHWRWSGPNADAYSAIVDEMGVLPLGDPRIDELFVEAMELWLEDLPIIPISEAKKIIPFDTTYWTGWPTYYDNHYFHPPTWWQSTHKIIHNLEPVPPQ